MKKEETKLIIDKILDTLRGEGIDTLKDQRRIISSAYGVVNKKMKEKSATN